MVRQNIAEIEEYRDNGFVIKKLYKGARSEAMLLHLKPGQEVPPHPHDSVEVTLIPQKGQATLNVSGRAPVALSPGTVHYEEAGRRFGIANNGEENFQMMVVIVRTEPDSVEPEAER